MVAAAFISLISVHDLHRRVADVAQEAIGTTALQWEGNAIDLGPRFRRWKLEEAVRADPRCGVAWLYMGQVQGREGRLAYASRDMRDMGSDRLLDARELARQLAQERANRLKTEAPFWKREAREGGARWIEARPGDHAERARWETQE